MNLFENGFSLEIAFGMLKRHAWTAAILFSVVLTMAVSLALFLPNLYSGSAVILVEGQQIPQEFVRATVTMALDRRLQTIGQEVLSRSRLEQLAGQMGLYVDLKEKGMDGEVIAAAMRQDIQVNLKGVGNSGTVAFVISYTSREPQKVALVANTLADIYIAENEKMRVAVSHGTEEFLRRQLEETKKNLEIQEQQVAQYKQRYLEELPEQRDANLQVLDSLQKQLQTTADNIARARERRAALGQMAEVESSLASLETFISPSSDGGQLGTLQGQLAQLKERGLTDRHPDVILLQKKIAAQEQQQTSEEKSSFHEVPVIEVAPMPTMSMSSAEIGAIDSELQRLIGDYEGVKRDIAAYQQRIENAPRHEQAMFSLSRDYNTTRELYTSLLKRADEASLAEDMERNQKSERFRLIEPAVDPTNPVAPQRIAFVVVGFILSLGVAVAGILAWEILDTSFHRVEDLKKFTKVPVLVTIPRIVTNKDRWRLRVQNGLCAVMLVVSLIVVVSVSYLVESGNEKLVRVFLRSPSNTAR